MNALVKKEIRLLLPNFGFACVLTLAWIFFPNDPTTISNSISYVTGIIFCPAMAVMLALSSFGTEIGAGTFSNLLAQPISRQKIWETKIIFLSVALTALSVLWIGSFLIGVFHSGQDHDVKDWLNLFSIIIPTGLVIFSGGLWTVLLLRQVAAAFWFILLVPGFLLVILSGLFAECSDEFQKGLIVSVLGLYSLAGFFFARWLFFRAQDLQWSGGTIVMPEMRGLKWWGERPREPQATLETGSRGRSSHRLWRPRAALFWKEVQLHQSQFILAGALAVLHLGVLALRKFGNYQRNSSMEFILEIFWGLWLVMPMLVGAAAVAEERKLGTLQSQFCLPVKRRSQFAVKFRVAMVLSVLFGVVMPRLLEGSRILPDVHFGFNPSVTIAGLENLMGWQRQTSLAQISFWNCFGALDVLLPLLTLVGMATVIGAISFYASTLTRNTLQALAPSVLGLMLTFFLFFALNQPDAFGFHLPWRGWLIYFVGVPTLAIALLALSFGNFKRVNIGGNVWLRNAFVFAAALAFVVATTSAIYHRAWEKLTPFEPAHGAARLSLANPPTLSEQWNSISVRLPDGRIWTDDYALNADAPNPLVLLLGDIKLASFGGGHFLGGSNWVKMVRSPDNEKIGIKSDGTLWISENPPRRERLANGQWKIIKAGDLAQFGSETNWNSIVPLGWPMLLFKSNGTLWRFGPTNWNWKIEWPGLRSFTPRRLGTESNWAEVFLNESQPFLRKTDGSVWTTWVYGGSSQQTNELEPGLPIERTSLFQHGKWRNTTTIRAGLSYNLGVRDDGTFRIWADQKIQHNSRYGYYEWTEVDLQFGTDTNWLGVAGRGEKIVTLKNDGTLWLWNFSSRRSYFNLDEQEMLNTKPTRLGTHSDWIAVASTDGGIISLAADGSLWYWPLESANYIGERGARVFFDGNNSHFEPLLDISRKPQLVGNIFGNADFLIGERARPGRSRRRPRRRPLRCAQSNHNESP